MESKSSQIDSSLPLHMKEYFGDQIRTLAGLQSKPEADSVIEAFMRVSREDYAGKGPWKIMSPLQLGIFQATPDANPKHLYHSVLISLDQTLGINIGEPTLWARMFSHLQIKPGSNVLQIGAGSGYYSTVLANLVGQQGKVTGFEVNASMVNIGSAAIRNTPNLDIKIGDATQDLLDANRKFDLIIAFAGVTHPVKIWLDALADNGTMLLPITGSSGWGAMCVFKKINSNHFSCETLGSCGFYYCQGARNLSLETQLEIIWGDQAKLFGWVFDMRHDAKEIEYEFDGEFLRATFD